MTDSLHLPGRAVTLATVSPSGIDISYSERFHGKQKSHLKGWLTSECYHSKE